MSSEIDIAYLKHFPTLLFKQLIDKWKKTSIDLKPNNLLSDENLSQTEKIIKNLTAAKRRQLLKLSEAFNISDKWWDIYQVSKILPVPNLLSRKKSFSVEKYLEKNHEKIKGIFTPLKLSEHAILIFIEFSSRSALLKNDFRFIYFPTAKKVLVEQKDLAHDIFKDEILPFITKEPKNAAKKPIRARTIKSLTKQTEESNKGIILTDLTIRISLETSGIDGLDRITIKGNDVLRGAET
ncbi:MAG: hypothetical protein ACW964_15570, partial [Candidatus Hodarchaeales archaeon]